MLESLEQEAGIVLWVKMAFVQIETHGEYSMRRYTGQQLTKAKSGFPSADKLVIFRRETADLRVLIFHRFTLYFFRSCFRRDVKTIVFFSLAGKRDTCLLVEPTCRRPTLPGPTLPRRPAVCRTAPAHPNPPVVFPCFIRVLKSVRRYARTMLVRQLTAIFADNAAHHFHPKGFLWVQESFDKSNVSPIRNWKEVLLKDILSHVVYLWDPRPKHTTGGSGCGGARLGSGVGRERAGRDADVSVLPKKPSFFLFAKQSKTTLLGVSLEAQTNEIRCKSIEKQNIRLTTG